MELNLQPLMEWAQNNAQLLTFVFIALCVFFFSIAAIQLGQQVFTIYRKRFYRQVDQGLRDVVVMMEPGQVFAFTMVLVIILGPLIFFFSNAVVAATFMGFALITPGIVLRVMKSKRSDKFISQLPDALAAMASAMRSGLNLVKSIQQIVKNQPHPLAQEFAQVLVEYRVGTELNDSLDALSMRIDRQEVVLMNSAIKISRAVGGNLADTLDTLSKTLREKSKVEGKINALTSMGKAQGTMAALFPVFIGYVFFKIEPEAMGLLFTSQLGLIWLGIMTTMAAMAFILIRKIVTVDI